MHRSWGTLVAVVGVAIGFTGGIIYEQQASLKATVPPVTTTTTNKSDWLKEQLVQNAVKKMNAGESSSCQQVNEATSFIKKEISNCYKVTYNRFNMQLKIWKKEGTGTIPIFDSESPDSQTQQKLANYIIKLADGDDPEEGSEKFETQIDTWIYTTFDWDWIFEYYDSSCKLKSERTTKNETIVIHIFNSGPNTETQMDKYSALPTGFPTTGYILVKCLTFAPSDLPLTYGSLDNCTRCKKKVLPGANTPIPAL